MRAFARFRGAALAGMVSLGITSSLVGCAEEDPDAHTNGVGRLSPTAIEAKAREAAKGARSVRLSGKVTSNGRRYRLDMRLKQDGAMGKVTTKDATFSLLRVGDDLYLKADKDFWLDQNDPSDGGTADAEPDRDAVAAAEKLDGKYVKVPADDPAYRQFSGFTTLDVMLDGLLALQGERATGERREVGGVRTIQVTADEGKGGVIDVALVGKPFPLRMQRAGGAGVLHLDDWNKDFTIRAPSKKQTVDYGEEMLPPRE